MESLKEKIIHTALRLFSTKGYMSTSITDILEAVGASKGGFYNHFHSKEELFLAVLSQARKIWRERNLAGLAETPRPVEKIKKLLANYRDRYLADAENFPGGCIFVTLAVELNGQAPHLAREVNEGFVRLKNMIKRLLDQGREEGSLKEGVDTEVMAELIFSGLLGASVTFMADKSRESLERNIQGLSTLLESLSQ